MTKGFQAIKIAAVGFIIPFILIYYPSISFVIGFDWSEFIWIMVRLPVAVWLIASAFIGCDTHALSAIERILRTLFAVVMLIVDPTMQIGGFVLGAGTLALHRIRARSKQAAV